MVHFSFSLYIYLCVCVCMSLYIYKTQGIFIYCNKKIISCLNNFPFTIWNKAFPICFSCMAIGFQPDDTQNHIWCLHYSPVCSEWFLNTFKCIHYLNHRDLLKSKWKQIRKQIWDDIQKWKDRIRFTLFRQSGGQRTERKRAGGWTQRQREKVVPDGQRFTCKWYLISHLIEFWHWTDIFLWIREKPLQLCPDWPLLKCSSA